MSETYSDTHCATQWCNSYPGPFGNLKLVHCGNKFYFGTLWKFKYINNFANLHAILQQCFPDCIAIYCSTLALRCFPATRYVSVKGLILFKNRNKRSKGSLAVNISIFFPNLHYVQGRRKQMVFFGGGAGNSGNLGGSGGMHPQIILKSRTPEIRFPAS